MGERVLRVLKRQREREGGKDRERSRCSLRNDSTIAWSIFFPLFLFLSRASLSFSLFAFPLFACISASVCSFVFTRHFYLSFVYSSVFPCAYSMCLSLLSLSLSLSCSFKVMEAYAKRLNAVRRCNLTALSR